MHLVFLLMKFQMKLNESIRYASILVIDESGNPLGVFTSEQGRQLAAKKGLDLLLINPNADPPVCKIVNYGKYKFELEKKAKAKRKNQSQLKEIQMSYNMEEHDYQVRLSQACKFLKAGDKVKVTLMLKGREMQHLELAQNKMAQFQADVSSLAQLAKPPSQEGRNLSAIFVPKKS
uniref:Translation initiation factor IF-3, chloroplastic n=2 Tax=Cyanidioschyzon merolae TaxID=45157 RepID=IF3C_CYAM1|nr:translation initiation factor 3 [Cyanidioschyzon merolae strain 10D]Q85G77.1 RecName: Full=Translation initiation factor IF-3, chloroplastic [Cyanidioschyzon merolae strain 10D]QFV16931.1 initiation factor 3 [Cyanidioschyzon merolae]QFV17110.1 initiation factor 3 [Cyanidioschyzon merolae]BAC76113.1 initiation factor 3 [Cyanidioschyzon merolae strain 10D]